MIMLEQAMFFLAKSSNYPTIFGLPLGPLLVIFGIVVIIVGFIARHFENKKKKARLEARRKEREADKAQKLAPTQPVQPVQPVAEKPVQKPTTAQTTTREPSASPRKTTGSSRRRRTRPEE